jgi:hypothetical protein
MIGYSYLLRLILLKAIDWVATGDYSIEAKLIFAQSALQDR